VTTFQISTWKVAAIDDCLVSAQFTGSQQLRPVAGQWIWLFQEARSVPDLGLRDRAINKYPIDGQLSNKGAGADCV